MVHFEPGHRMTRRRALGAAGVLAAPLVLAGALPARIGAQEDAATAPAGTPEPAPEVVGMVQLMHLEKTYFYLPGFQDEGFLAGIFGIDVETYRAIKADFAAAARGAAGELLADSAFAAQVDRLPFGPGSRVAAIGASMTDDLQSWFEILRHLLDLRRPGDGIDLVNAGISGQNTSQALGQMATNLMEPPDRVFCLLGGNDAMWNNANSTKTEVAIEETQKNLAEMRHLAGETGTSWVWLTLPPVDEARVEAYPGFQFSGVRYRNADVAQVNAFLVRQPEPVVDLNTAFGDPVGSDLLGLDGVHPTLAGQIAIARAVVERLAV